jgi:hypothetical protein
LFDLWSQNKRGQWTVMGKVHQVFLYFTIDVVVVVLKGPIFLHICNFSVHHASVRP